MKPVDYRDLDSCLAVAGNGAAYSRDDLCIAVSRLAADVEQLRGALVNLVASASNLCNVAEEYSRQDTPPKYALATRDAIAAARAALGADARRGEGGLPTIEQVSGCLSGEQIAERQAARRAVAGEGAAPRQSCEWTEDQDGIWQTDCGQEFTFIDAGPTENQMKFCAYCGKPLRPVTYKEDIEAGEPQPSAPAERGGVK